MNLGEGTPNLFKPYRLPSSYGTSGTVLTTDGAGGLSWAAGGGGSSGYSGYSGPSGYSGYSGKSGYSGMFGGDTQPYSLNVSGILIADPPEVASGIVYTSGVALASTTVLYFSCVNADSINIANWLAALDDSSNVPHGFLRVVNRGDSSKFVDFSITSINTAYISDPTNPQVVVTVSVVASGNTVAGGDNVLVSYTRAGDSGYSGRSGYSGYSGPSGYSGYSGPSGYSGYSGPTGASGFSGYSGASGYSGYSGKSGYSGYSGKSGYSGYSAATGASGFSGYSGPTGASGYSGYSGRSGYSGYSATGASGYSGYSGPAWAEASPAQITSNQNDYSFTSGTSLLRLSCDANGRKITGFAGGSAGKVLYVRNVGTKELLFTNQDTGSSAANRLILPYPVSFVLRPDDTYEFIYDSTTQRWVMVGGYDSFLKDPMYCSYLFDDFASGSAASNAAGELGWNITGAGTSTRMNPETTLGGIYFSASAGQDRCGTLGNSASVATENSDQYVFGARIKLGTAIADGTNDYYCAIGIGDNLGTQLTKVATINNSFVGLVYDRTVSANWCYTTSDGGTTTETASSVAVAADTWYDLAFTWRVTDSTATFYVNGASVGTTTGTFPVGSAISLGNFYYYKIAGASARWFYIDYFKNIIIRTTKRV